MIEKTLRKDIWESAGYAGLALGLVSLVYMYITNILGSMELTGFSMGAMILLGAVLWIAKFVGCILLLRFLMKKFSAAHPEASNKDVYHMGMASALLSAFFFASLQFIDMSYISTEFYAAQYQIILKEYSRIMDSNTLSMLKELMNDMPMYTFAWTLIYCTAYGSLLSAILSRNIPSKDPFADYKPE